MATNLFNVDWLNQNANRNYPIVDGASGLDSNNIQIPTGLIADLSFPVPIGTINPADTYIGSINGFNTGFVLTLNDFNSAAIIASVTVFTSSAERFSSYSLVGQGAYAGAIGRLTVGYPQALQEAASRSSVFAPADTRLVPAVIRPLISGVQSISVQALGGANITGPVNFLEGDNITLGVSGNSIIINSGLLEPEEEDDNCGCDPDVDTSDDGPCIRTINGVTPDGAGNFKLETFDCTVLDPIEGGLRILDTCVEPCCGCDQLDGVQGALQAVENELSRLDSAAQQIRSRVDNLATTLSNAAINAPTVGEECGSTYWYLPISSSFTTLL